MSIHLERDLDELKKRLLSMGAKVERSIERGVEALLERRADAVDEVVDEDDHIDRMEVRIEEEGLKILALHQPVAEDLRFIAAVLKVNNDLERMADYAVNMVERAEFLMRHEPIPIPERLEQMARATLEMVEESLDALVTRNPEQAREVCRKDDMVDDLNREIIDGLVQRMQSDPDCIEPCLHLFSASRYLERIADHATNIAEDVVYLVEGQIIRHRHR